jgi:ATP-dependent DNA helicase RecG
MPRHEYERRLVERLHATRRWENEPVPEGVSIKDLDKQEIQITLDNAIRLGRLESSVRRDLPTILRGLELIREDKLLNAAVALYGKSDRLKSLYPQMGVRLARFRGVNRLADFSDNRQYWGHALSLLRRAESFLHESKPWNPIIANVFYRAGIIERWGSGTLNIIDWCAENANPRPTWHEQAGSVYVTFLPAALPAAQQAMRKHGSKATPRRGEVTVEVTGEVTGEVASEVRQLLCVMKTAMSRSEIQQALSLKGQSNFRNRYLLPALRDGLIEMTIPGKPNSRMQKYRLTAKGRNLLSRQ